MGYRVMADLWHRLTAWNTGGEGIHSPNLFYVVRHLLYDKNGYYAWSTIEGRRQAMLRAPKTVHVVDYGTGGKAAGAESDKLVMHIAQTSLASRRQGELLFRLLVYLSEKQKTSRRGLHVVELGTSLGITTAYLAMADVRNRIVTFEGSPDLVAMAQFNWQKLGIDNVRAIVGNIDDTLPQFVCGTQDRLDLVFMDANHTYEATVDYFNRLLPLCGDETIVAVDDIRYSRVMNKAWRQLCQHERVSAALDLGKMGLLFFNPYLDKHIYKLRGVV